MGVVMDDTMTGVLFNMEGGPFEVGGVVEGRGGESPEGWAEEVGFSAAMEKRGGEGAGRWMEEEEVLVLAEGTWGGREARGGEGGAAGRR